MALREINLVPYDLLSRRHMLRHVKFWAGCLILSLSLIFGFRFFQNNVALAQKGISTTLKEVEIHLNKKIEGIQRIKAELDKLSQQQAAFEIITKNPAYSEILYRLAGMMTGDIWLTRLSLTSEKTNRGNIKIGLSGYCTHNEEVGNLINDLSAESLFENPQLKFAKEVSAKNDSKNSGQSDKRIQFQIDFEILGS